MPLASTLAAPICMPLAALLVAVCIQSPPPTAATRPAASSVGASTDDRATEEKMQDPLYVLGYTVRRIDGEDVDLTRYEGKVVLIVNVASRCGLTRQYEALQALYEERKDDGLVILGFPANDFMGQEPGSNEEIAEFCRSNFGVTFPMFAKISVKGDERHPLYERLAEAPEPAGGEPTWNFTKYLVGRDGRAARRFDPRTRPDDEALIAEIERLRAVEPAAD